jgi:hypothetical protein
LIKPLLPEDTSFKFDTLKNVSNRMAELQSRHPERFKDISKGNFLDKDPVQEITTE